MASIKSAASATKNGVIKFVEELGAKVFIGAGTVYLARGGQINTLEDVKAVAIAGALAGVLWALAAAKAYVAKQQSTSNQA